MPGIAFHIQTTSARSYSKAAAELGISRWHIGKAADRWNFGYESAGAFPRTERRIIHEGFSTGESSVTKRTGSSQPSADGRRSEGLARGPHQGFDNTNRAASTDQEAVFRSVVLLNDFSARLRRTDCLPKCLRRRVRVNLQKMHPLKLFG